MDLSNWILVAQLVVLFLTGAVIVWYTIETREIRRGTTSQAVLNPNAKIWDRQNEIDRILFTHPALAKQFDEMSDYKYKYFTAPTNEVKRNENYFQMKELVYLHLNFFEEIFTTTTSTTASIAVIKQFKREKWDDFIVRTMHHALLREVFVDERNVTYTGEFLHWMIKQKDIWNGDFDSYISQVVPTAANSGFASAGDDSTQHQQ